MPSDSDRTIDSDELEEIIEKAKKEEEMKRKKGASSKKAQRRESFHDLSDSDSSEETFKKKKKIGNVAEKPKCQYGKNCFRKNSDHRTNFDHGDDNPEISKPAADKVVKESSKEARPKCPYGKNCYRKNPIHLKEYDHGGDVSEDTTRTTGRPSNSRTDTSAEKPKIPLCLNYQFYLTKVNGIKQQYNELSLDIKDILKFKDGTLISSAQFNYLFDIPWLMEQYPEKYRSCPLTIIHGEQRESKKSLEKSGAEFPNITFCQAKLDIPFGTHHTKMMFLHYKEGFRVVIHTSNIVDSDWFQRTQGMWVSPVLPKLSTPSSTAGESPTHFKGDLLEYVSAYAAPGLDTWSNVIKEHDFSSIRVVLIGSVPGRHAGNKKSSFGHLKLRKVLSMHGKSKEVVKLDWPTVCQFSSIGSLGSSPDLWLQGELATSLSTTSNSPLTSQSANLKLVYPTVENVRKSLQGYPAGGSLPYSIKVAQKQPYLKNFLHQWKSDVFGRSEASPHIKTYLRMSPDSSSVAWFLVTSANMSKAAWGATEKKGAQFMIRSYELGVLFLPKFFDLEVFASPSAKSDPSTVFPVPYDLPLVPYSKEDQPWIWDIPHMHAPDRFGMMWCPP